MTVTEYPFTVEFVWRKTPPAERPENPPGTDTEGTDTAGPAPTAG